VFRQDKYAWTESHYWLTSGSPALANAIAPAQQLASYRVPCLGNGCSLTRIRLSSYPANRETVDIDYSGAVSGPTWPADPTGLLYSASRSFTALLGTFTGQGTGQSNYYLGGIPVSLGYTVPGDTTGVQWGSCPGFSSRAAALNSFLTDGAWGWLTRGTTVTYTVQGVVTNAAVPGMIGLIWNPAAPLPAVGSVVVVKGFRRINTRLPPLGGVWKVGQVLAGQPAAGQTSVFLFNSGAVPPANYLSLGSAGVFNPSFNTYTFLQWVEIVSRKRGGSIGAPRGRSRIRA
jgi:hypothetical protein